MDTTTRWVVIGVVGLALAAGVVWISSDGDHTPTPEPSDAIGDLAPAAQKAKPEPATKPVDRPNKVNRLDGGTDRSKLVPAKPKDDAPAE